MCVSECAHDWGRGAGSCPGARAPPHCSHTPGAGPLVAHQRAVLFSQEDPSLSSPWSASRQFPFFYNKLQGGGKEKKYRERRKARVSMFKCLTGLISVEVSGRKEEGRKDGREQGIAGAG